MACVCAIDRATPSAACRLLGAGLHTVITARQRPAGQCAGDEGAVPAPHHGNLRQEDLPEEATASEKSGRKPQKAEATGGERPIDV